MDIQTITPAIVIALIMALAQIAKKKDDMNGFIPAKFIPLFNIVLGVGYGLYSSLSVDGLILGLMIGASACGVFDFATGTFVGGEKEPEIEEESSEVK